MFLSKTKNPFMAQAEKAEKAKEKTVEALRLSIVQLKKEQEALKKKTVTSHLLASKDPRIDIIESLIKTQSSLMLYIISAVAEVTKRRANTHDKTINHNAQATLSICEYTNGFIKNPGADDYADLRAGKKVQLTELAHIPSFSEASKALAQSTPADS